MSTDILKSLQENYPFLSYFEYDGDEYVGIIQKVTSQFIWLYDFDRIRDTELEAKFLEYGQEWYFQSNMEIPVEMFIGGPFDAFKPTLRGFVRSAVTNYVGPQVNLGETFKKRIKKKKIELVRNLD